MAVTTPDIGEIAFISTSTDGSDVYLTINEWGWVSYEELWRSRRVLLYESWIQ